MKIFDKIKNGLVNFSKKLSSVDVPDTTKPEDCLQGELKETLALADGMAYNVASMAKDRKNKFSAKINEQGTIQRSVNKEINKEIDREIGD